MPNSNLFNADLPAGDVAKIKQHTADIKALMPFLRSIPAGKEKNLRKRRLDDASFISSAGLAAAQLPGAMPGLFATPDFVRDAALLTSLHEVLSVLGPLKVLVEDTLRQLHDETASQASEVLHAFKQAAKTNAEARTLLDPMEAHYAANGNRPNTPPAPPK